MEYFIEMIRTGGPGELRLTLRDGPAPKSREVLSDEDGQQWAVIRREGSEVVVRPLVKPSTKLLPEPSGMRLVSCARLSKASISSPSDGPKNSRRSSLLSFASK